jgi:hypothetical protein
MGAIGSGSATIGPHIGADAVADWLASLWGSLASQRRHAFVGLLATSTSAGGVHGRATFLLLGAYAAHSRLEVTGTYDFTLRRERGEWRVARMVATFDSSPESIPERGPVVNPRSG